MDKSEYGEKFNEHLLEQYKLYVEMADKVSERRMQTNKFYISLLSALFALFSILASLGGLEQYLIFIIISPLGIVLCILWYINIRSYRQLNSGKFKVIHEMEQFLPFFCYDKEWKVLGKEKEKNQYLQFTKIERYIPIILAIPYIILFLYTLGAFVCVYFGKK